MNSHFPNNHDLNQRLDQAVPPHTRTIGTADTDPLIAVAQRLAQGPNVHFSQAALDRIEAQLQAQMDTMPQYQVRRKRNLMRVLPYAAALVLVFCLTLTMAGRAAASSLPGDNLYPVKRMMEGIQLALTSEDDKAEFHVTLAEHRSDEFVALLEQGHVYPQALVEANDELNRAVDLLAAGQGSWSEVRSRVIGLVDHQNKLILAAQQQASADEQVRLLAVISDQVAVQQRLETLDTPSTPPVLTLTPSATQTATTSSTTTPNLTTPTMTNSPTATPSPITTASRTKTPRPTATPTVTNSSTATPSPTLQPPPSTPTTFVEQPTASGAGNPGYGQGSGPSENTPPAEPGSSSGSGQGNNFQGGNPTPNGSSNGGNHP